MDKYITISALFISSLTLLSTIFFALNNLLSQKISDKAKKLEVREKYCKEVVEWSNLVIDIVQESTHFILIEITEENTDVILKKREELRTRCSIIIDKGRWVFPNVEENVDNKFSGYGKDTLNCVVWIYKFISSINTKSQENNWELRDNILETKREFIDQVKKIINPKTRVEEYKKIFD